MMIKLFTVGYGGFEGQNTTTQTLVFVGYITSGLFSVDSSWT